MPDLRSLSRLQPWVYPFLSSGSPWGYSFDINHELALHLRAAMLNVRVDLGLSASGCSRRSRERSSSRTYSAKGQLQVLARNPPERRRHTREVVSRLPAPRAPIRASRRIQPLVTRGGTSQAGNEGGQAAATRPGGRSRGCRGRTSMRIESLASNAASQEEKKRHARVRARHPEPPRAAPLPGAYGSLQMMHLCAI